MAEEQKFFETADGYVLQGRDDEVRPFSWHFYQVFRAHYSVYHNNNNNNKILNTRGVTKYKILLVID